MRAPASADISTIVSSLTVY